MRWRGKNVTAELGTLQCRLATLGLKESFERCCERLDEQTGSRMKKLAQLRELHGEELDRNPELSRLWPEK